MKSRASLILLSVFCVSKVIGQSADNNKIAKTLIEKSIQAMGGDRWKSVNSLWFEGYGYENMIDESERPAGPFIPIQLNRSFLKDLSTNRSQVKQTEQTYTFNNQQTLLINDDEIAMKRGDKLMSTEQVSELGSELNLAPERVLWVALASPDLKYLKDTVFQQAKHAIVTFKYEGYPVRLFLNRETDLITVAEITRPFTGNFRNIWGDVKKTIIYSFWMIFDKGLHYPLIQDTYLDSWYEGSFIINKWKVNPALNADSLLIPKQVIEQGKQIAASTKDRFKKQLDASAKEIEPGVWFLPGICNTTIINQQDGLVIIESAYSSFYGELIVNKAKALFPGKKIKALISTTDNWLHIGGMRTFAALPNITIYHSARNHFIVDKLLKATYKSEPDELAKTAKPSYKLAAVSDSLSVGTGPNRLMIYAYKTETGDKMLMVYFPQHQLIYTSDLYQPKDDKGNFWNPQMPFEVYQSLLNLRKPIKQFYAMHTPALIPYTDLVNDFKE